LIFHLFSVSKIFKNLASLAKEYCLCQMQWLMTVVTALQEQNIRRTMIRGQPAKSKQDPPHLNKNARQVACTYHPSDGLKLKVGGLRSRLAWTNK
jgi:hypothetical protein